MGDYLLSVWLKFEPVTGATLRDVWFASGVNTIARSSRTAIASTDIHVNLTQPYRVVNGAAPETVNVLVRSGTATTITTGNLTVTRIGSGPKGDIGPQGIQGPIGATGATGPAGPSGTANSGFAKYADMLPH